MKTLRDITQEYIGADHALWQAHLERVKGVKEESLIEESGRRFREERKPIVAKYHAEYSAIYRKGL